jgi:hypothetical protein
MKADFTRSTFRPQKHYSSVRMQQGRVQLDADWNEQVDITAHRIETETVDVIGTCGAPQDHPGFALSAGALPQISAGRFYLDGILAENEKAIDIDKQPDLPGFVLKKDKGDYLAYLDVWQRHVTALEDDLIREVALGGPDTATRTQTLWQVKLIGPLPDGQTCLSEPDDWKKLLNAAPGRMRAKTTTGSLPANLCDIPSGGGYRRLENQLYRVEIHTGGARGAATFKWSRDNGSILTLWNAQDGNDLIVQSAGRDDVLGFAPGQTVELTDDDRELRGEAGVLVKLGNVEGQVLTLDAAYLTSKGITVDRSTFGRNPKIRRWDSDGDIKTSANFTALEDGVEVMFETGDYKPGDYWVIPARTAKADIEWPADPTDATKPAAVDRQGIVHHFCKLAILHSDGATFTVDDCRPLFPPLTALTRFFYVGGDGQEAMPGSALALPLQVGVVNGAKPVQNANVSFTGTGTLAGAAGTATLPTSADGIARCAWTPDQNGPDFQQVIATLLDADGNPTSHPPIQFNASLSVARQVAYTPGACVDLAGAQTVQEALDTLCSLPRGVGGCCCVTVGTQNGDFKTLKDAILNLLVEKKRRNVCICILTEEQEPVSGINIDPNLVESGAHLEIKGCALARLELSEPVHIEGLASLQLKDLILTVPQFEQPDGFFQLVNCDRILIENVVMQGPSDTGTLLRIQNASWITLQNNRLYLLPGPKGQLPGRVFAGTSLEALFTLAESARRASARRVIANLVQSSQAERNSIVSFIKPRLAAVAGEMTDPERQTYQRFLEILSSNQVNMPTLTAALNAIRRPVADQSGDAALELDDAAAETVLANNIILGPLVIYGPMPGIPDEGGIKQLFGDLMAITKEDLSTISEQTHLHLRGNTLTQLLISSKALENPDLFTKATGIFESAFLSDDDFNQPQNQVLAFSLGIQNSTFLAPGTRIQAAVICDDGAFSTNRAFEPESIFLVGAREIQQAANVRISVQNL